MITGLCYDEEIPISEKLLYKYKQMPIFYSEDNYYGSKPLPQEWMEIFEQKPDEATIFSISPSNITENPFIIKTPVAHNQRKISMQKSFDQIEAIKKEIQSEKKQKMKIFNFHKLPCSTPKKDEICKKNDNAFHLTKGVSSSLLLQDYSENVTKRTSNASILKLQNNCKSSSLLVNDTKPILMMHTLPLKKNKYKTSKKLKKAISSKHKKEKKPKIFNFLNKQNVLFSSFPRPFNL